MHCQCLTKDHIPELRLQAFIDSILEEHEELKKQAQEEKERIEKEKADEEAEKEEAEKEEAEKEEAEKEEAEKEEAEKEEAEKEATLEGEQGMEVEEDVEDKMGKMEIESAQQED